ncbi:hypothetical protein [uncultured Corynebacterium sp.]|uniref:hypothetical protein n=1 Tax=uncultured Corynebacterium sp. TaxID=159447 RepID=UPI0025FBE2C5|nr:hypothetical protein [uncultured Corynebacterium sp.]
MFDAFHAVANNAADIFQNTPFEQVQQWVQAPFQAVQQVFQPQPAATQAVSNGLSSY